MGDWNHTTEGAGLPAILLLPKGPSELYRFYFRLNSSTLLVYAIDVDE